MPKALEAIAALKGKWAGVSDRASLDQPAINVPKGIRARNDHQKAAGAR